jgi:exopolysaccharide biosynthesis WecB/TagA/CpsF family protein
MANLSTSFEEESLLQALAATQRVRVAGLPVAVLGRLATAELMVGLATATQGAVRRSLLFTTINGQVAALCSHDVAVRRLYEQADLISADGMSAVFASRLRCPVALPERVATTDAFHDAARLAVTRGTTFFFFGADEETNRAATERMARQYPALRIVGRRHGYFTRDEEGGIVEMLNHAAPDVLWLGLGVPLQQQFALRHRDRLTGVGVIKTCGGLFDFLAGRRPRAPRWMQKSGVEWVYRAAIEPRRLGWRYLTTNPRALYALLSQSGAVPRQDRVDAAAD